MLPVSLPFAVVRLLIGEDDVVGGLGSGGLGSIFTYKYRNMKKMEIKERLKKILSIIIFGCYKHSACSYR